MLFVIPISIPNVQDQRQHVTTGSRRRLQVLKAPVSRRAGKWMCATEWERKMMKEVGAWKGYDDTQENVRGTSFAKEISVRERSNNTTAEGSGAKDSTLSNAQLLPGDSVKGRRCGFVTLLGASNVGKSTLLNKMVKEKIAIVSRKVQTTRCRILGVMQEGASQIVLLDTPGVFRGNDKLGRAMVKAAWRAERDADVDVLVIDAAESYRQASKIDKEDMEDQVSSLNPFEINICQRLAERQKVPQVEKKSLILCLNKIDIVDPKHREDVRSRVLWELKRIGLQTEMIDETRFISARTGEGVDALVKSLARLVPESPWLYPEDALTDMPLRLMAAEMTRQYAFYNLDREVPYSIAVDTTSWETKRNSTTIYQNIYVARKSHKLIVTGKGGSMIKKIGSGARKELTEMLKTKVHLYLHVIVKANWKDMKSFYEPYGLEYKT